MAEMLYTIDCFLRYLGIKQTFSGLEEFIKRGLKVLCYSITTATKGDRGSGKELVPVFRLRT